MAVAEKAAEIAATVKEEYGKKRLTPASASKLYIADSIYLTALAMSGISPDSLKDKSMHNFIDIEEKMTSAQLAAYYSSKNLLQWIADERDKAHILVKYCFYDIDHHDCAISAMMARMTQKDAVDLIKDNKEKMQAFIKIAKRHSGTDDPTDEDLQATFDTVTMIKVEDDFENNMRYIYAYIKVIDMIAEALKMPLFALYRVNEEASFDSLERMAHRNDRVVEACISRIQARTGKGTYSPIRKYASDLRPPIPEENAKAAKKLIEDCIKGRRSDWKKIMPLLTRGYTQPLERIMMHE